MVNFFKNYEYGFFRNRNMFTDQNNNALEIEDNVNVSLIINTS